MGIMRSIFFFFNPQSIQQICRAGDGHIFRKNGKTFPGSGRNTIGKIVFCFLVSSLNASSFFYGSSLIVVNSTTSVEFCSVLLSRE